VDPEKLASRDEQLPLPFSGEYEVVRMRGFGVWFVNSRTKKYSKKIDLYHSNPNGRGNMT